MVVTYIETNVNNMWVDVHSIDKLLADYERKRGEESPLEGRLLTFDTGENHVYNPTPFIYDDANYLVSRVEPPYTEFDSQSRFFRQKNGIWLLDNNLPVFDLQDPYITEIGDEWVFMGVEAVPIGPDKSRYRTVFYKGEDPSSLEEFATSPYQMKDIRLVELHDGRIGMFTRPNGNIGEKGKIAFTILDSLNDIKDESVFHRGEIIDGLFLDNHWGGVNDVHLLDDNLLGVLGHMAYSMFDHTGHEMKHYYAITFTYNYMTGEASRPVIISTRDDFPETEFKRRGHRDVLYPGGLLPLNNNGLWGLYAGLSDAASGMKPVNRPFRYEA